jgi:hypothetical protein
MVVLASRLHGACCDGVLGPDLVVTMRNAQLEGQPMEGRQESIEASSGRAQSLGTLKAGSGESAQGPSGLMRAHLLAGTAAQLDPAGASGQQLASQLNSSCFAKEQVRRVFGARRVALPTPPGWQARAACSACSLGMSSAKA